MRRLVGLLAGLLPLLFALSASADCLEGMSRRHAGRSAIFQQVTAALKAALLAPPANWKVNAARDRDVGAFGIMFAPSRKDYESIGKSSCLDSLSLKCSS